MHLGIAGNRPAADPHAKGVQALELKAPLPELLQHRLAAAELFDDRKFAHAAIMNETFSFGKNKSFLFPQRQSMNNPCMEGFGSRLRSRIEAMRAADKKISEGEIARRVGASARRFSYWINDGREPPYVFLVKIAREVKLSTDELLGVTPFEAGSRIGERASPIAEDLVRLWPKIGDVQRRQLLVLAREMAASTPAHTSKPIEERTPFKAGRK